MTVARDCSTHPARAWAGPATHFGTLRLRPVRDRAVEPGLVGGADADGNRPDRFAVQPGFQRAHAAACQGIVPPTLTEAKGEELQLAGDRAMAQPVRSQDHLVALVYSWLNAEFPTSAELPESREAGPGPRMAILLRQREIPRADAVQSRNLWPNRPHAGRIRRSPAAHRRRTPLVRRRP